MKCLRNLLFFIIDIFLISNYFNVFYLFMENYEIYRLYKLDIF